jgi:hypothetical protein
VGRARAREVASAFVSSGYMKKYAKQYWSDSLGESLSGISNPKFIADGPFPGWSYTVTQAQAGKPAKEIKVYGYFTPTSTLEIYLYEKGESSALTSVVSSLGPM